MQTIIDCIVVGDGPAGLSAAINLRQRGKSVRVFGAGNSLLKKAEQVDNYLGMPGVSGSEMLAAFAAHATSLGVSPEADRVANILPFGDSIMLNVGGDIVQAKTVILATGVAKAKPVLGEAEHLGHGVSYCATCDGMLYRKKTVLVWGLSEEAPTEANFLASIGCTVHYVAAKRPETLDASIAFVQGVVQEIGGEGKVAWATVAGQKIAVEGVFILRAAIAPNALLDGIALENGFVQVNRQCATNIAGVYAAGDVTGTPLQVSKAVGEGLIAALSVAAYLDET